MKKTIGGDRLGSGAKMTVDLKTYERSTHNLGYIWKSTTASGTLVPCIKELALPGDTFDIDLETLVMTHPTIGPMLGSYKIQIDVFTAPIRLYQAVLHNNKLDIGLKMSRVKLPQIVISSIAPDPKKNMDNQQVNPSSLLSYLDIRGIGRGNTVGEEVSGVFNAVPLLAYWEIYKNYYANKQEEIGCYIHSGMNKTITGVTIATAGASESIPENSPGLATAKQLDRNSTGGIAYTGARPYGETIMLVFDDGRIGDIEEVFTRVVYDEITEFIELYNPTGEWASGKVKFWRYANEEEMKNMPPRIEKFPLENIDLVKEQILGTPITTPYTVWDYALAPYGPPLRNAAGEVRPLICSQEGLGLKTYQSDLYNNWMATEWIDGTDGISAVTAIDTTSGEFTLDTLNLSKKVYDMLNRIAISGGSYNDWIETVYTAKRYNIIESPVYHGGLIRELVFEEVVSNSATTGNEAQPLGTLAGKGRMGSKKKGGRITINVDEPSYIMGIFSLTPRIVYSQGNKWDTYLETMDDLHKPALDEIGFQDLLTRGMAWWDNKATTATTPRSNFSAGKQPAWTNYMTNVDVARGNFAVEDNEMFMTLNRRYEQDENGRIEDLTTYIDPVKYNYIFAETARDAQNFWVQVKVDITARRKMSAKLMPNL